MDGFGSITWWGFTPAVDLQDRDLITSLSEMNLDDDGNGSTEDCLNILIIGSGDLRHVLKTVCQAHRHSMKKLQFYIIENSMELYARHLLFLVLALEPQKRMGLQEKTELFLELFSNTLVRKQSMEYVLKMSSLLIKLVTDFQVLEMKLPVVDMSNLKFKERDMLEGIFKFWRNPDTSLFDISKCWDSRLRQYLGIRYDAIPNVFDWDYSMKLVDKGAGIIHATQYKDWRHRGVAYEVREGTYDVPNRTLASGMIFKQEGEQVARRGYWGDILVSPYIAFGIECEQKSFFKKTNNMYTKTVQDVSVFNILSLFHELAHHKKYSPPDTLHEQKSGSSTKLTELTEEDEEKEAEIAEDVASNAIPVDHEYKSVDVDFAKVIFLPLNSAPELHKKAKYQKKFHIVYISNSLVHQLTPELALTFKDTASVVLETLKFMLELKNEQQSEFIKKITSMAISAGCKVAEKCAIDDSFALFNYTRLEPAS